MPKLSQSFNPDEYALVADRITLFYERFPTGRIATRLISRERDVLFRASVYRTENDTRPAATGWASEREGDGEINLVACVENTETSAIGRALANLGFTASRKRPSREEMEKAERVRRAYGRDGLRVAESQAPSYAAPPQPLRAQPPAATEESQASAATTAHERDIAAARAELEQLIAKAELVGFPAMRAQMMRDTMERFPPRDIARLNQLSAKLRRWISERSS